MKARFNSFTKHPEDGGMTYWQHFRFAFNLAQLAFRACIASMVHAIFPFLFVTSTSRIVFTLYNKLKIRLPVDDLKSINKNTDIDLQYLGIIRKTGS